jgi:hypothetical protein
MVKVKERFESKVDRTGDCHVWTAYKNQDGYGKFKFDGRMVNAHRVAWSLVNGEIPPGMHVLHSCDNPGCVNPEHLFLGTHQDNMDDKVSKGRTARVLSSDLVHYIRMWSALGATQTHIANRIGVGRFTVQNVLSGRTWSHV